MNDLADVSAELAALAKALGGDAPPCRDDPDTWFESPATATAGCRRCPGIRECAALADATGEKYGVWGGRDYERHGRRHQAGAA